MYDLRINRYSNFRRYIFKLNVARIRAGVVHANSNGF